MIASNQDQYRDVFVGLLVREHGLSLRNLQQALEDSARLELPIDVILVQMEVLPRDAMVGAASAANFNLTAEQPAVPKIKREGSRSFVRHASDLQVSFKDWGDLRVAYVHNISRGGIGVTVPISATAPAIGSTLTLSLALPNGQDVEVKGVIRYCKDSEETRHIGIELHHSSADELLTIDSLLRSQLKAGSSS